MKRAVTATCAAILLLLFLYATTSSQSPSPLPEADPSKQTGRHAIMVQLDGPAGALVLAEERVRVGNDTASILAQRQVGRNVQAQDRLLAARVLADAPILFRVQRVYNGVALYLTPRQIAAVRQLPGVKAVRPLPAQVPMLLRTVPHLDMPAVWQAIYPNFPDAETVSIGIIDTGVDYLHLHLGGPGTGYDVNDPTTIEDTPGGIRFPTGKVMGGYDFAGDEYSASPGGDPIPRPDPDPMDCWGHGTHVAGIAAGQGVLRNGDPYTGTYDTQIDLSQFLIGPGVAPRAEIYGLKIFGCTGSSNLTVEALEWAVDPNGDGNFSDKLDVINMSIGSPYGSLDDPTVEATNNAALAGIVVVAAAGNNGDSYYITTAPGVADRAISVAATAIIALPTGRGEDGTSELSGFVDFIAPYSSRGPRRADAALKPDIAAPGSSIGSAALGTGAGKATFSGTSMATPHIAGMAALLRARYPGWTPEELKALLLNTARYNLLASIMLPPQIYGAGRAGAGRVAPGPALQNDLLMYSTGDPGQVSLSFGRPSILGETSLLKNVRLANKGPLTHTLSLRYAPVVDMPGADISLPTDNIRLTPYNSVNVAVVATATGGDLAYVADPTVDRTLRFPRHWLSEETGYLYAWPSPTRFTADMTGATQRPAVNSALMGRAEFQFLPETGVLSYSLAITGTGSFTITGVGLYAGSLGIVGPQLQALFTDTMTATSVLRAQDAITLTAEQINLLAADFVYVNVLSESYPNGEIRGQLQTDQPPIRLPVYMAPRPAAAMRAKEATLVFGSAPTGTMEVELVGQGLLSAESLAAGKFPTDTVSVASAFELQFSSPNEAGTKDVQDHADLRYVGIASDIRATATVSNPLGSTDTARLLFAINTYGEWSTPNEVTFSIFIDTNEDGIDDYRLYSGNYEGYRGGGNSDEFFSLVENLATGQTRLAYFLNLVSSAELNTAIFDNSVLLMAVDAAQLELDDRDSDFQYRVQTVSIDEEMPGVVLDSTPYLFYDLRHPGLDATNRGIGGFPIYYDLPGEKIEVFYDRDAFRVNGSDGLLLLHHHNELATRAELLAVEGHYRLHFPVIQVAK